MTVAHKTTAGLAAVGALALLAAILLGDDHHLPATFAVNRSIRDIAVALWSFLLPAWFMLEEAWFAPPQSEPEKLARFHAGQTKARLTWVVVGGAVGIIIGLTAPTLTSSRGAAVSSTSNTPFQKS